MVIVKTIFHLIVILDILCISWIIGEFFCKRLFSYFYQHNQDYYSHIYVGLGLGIISYFTLIMGFFHLLYGWIFRCIFILLNIIFISKIVNCLSIIWDTVRKLSSYKIGILIILCVIPVILGLIAPETGHDSLAYHLVYPAYFIKAHKIYFIPYAERSIWPFFMEMLYTTGLLIWDDIIAKGFHFICYIFLIVSIFNLLRRTSHKIKYISAFVIASTPGIMNETTYTYVDVGLTFFCILSLYCFIEWYKKNNISFLYLCVIFSGCALSIKVIASYFLVPLFFLILFIGKKRIIFKQWIIVFLLFILVGSFYYIRSYIILDNPVFPLYSQFFKGRFETVGRELSMEKGYIIKYHSKNIITFFKLPWIITMYPHYIGGGMEESCSLVYLFMLPFVLAIVLSRRYKILVILSYLTIGYFLLWFTFSPMYRFLFPSFGLITILIGYTLGMIKKHIRRTFVIFIIIIGLWNIAMGFYFQKKGLYYLIYGKEKYLNKYERTYPTIKIINKYLSTKHILLNFAFIRIYYLKCISINGRRFLLFNSLNNISKNNDFFSLLEGINAIVYTDQSIKRYPILKDILKLFHGKKILLEVRRWNGEKIKAYMIIAT